MQGDSDQEEDQYMMSDDEELDEQAGTSKRKGMTLDIDEDEEDLPLTDDEAGEMGIMDEREEEDDEEDDEEDTGAGTQEKMSLLGDDDNDDGEGNRSSFQREQDKLKRKIDKLEDAMVGVSHILHLCGRSCIP